jgi:alginate O-acetyltransferase complex protein AlgI
MALCGVWHGAGWTFVIWGMWHGIFIVLENLFPAYQKVPKILRQVFTFFIVMLGWVCFRSQNMGQVYRILRGLFFSNWALSFSPTALLANPLSLFLAGVGVLYCFFIEKEKNIFEEKSSGSRTLFLLALFLISLLIALSQDRLIPFLYFQF